jgi:hypothetical protein
MLTGAHAPPLTCTSWSSSSSTSSRMAGIEGGLDTEDLRLSRRVLSRTGLVACRIPLMSRVKSRPSRD